IRERRVVGRTMTTGPASAPAAISSGLHAGLPQRALPWSAKLYYGFGEIPVTVTMVMFGLFAMFFYNSVMGLPAALVGLGIAAGLGIDVLLDPYIGYRSDRSAARFGRRHSFMLPGALAMGPCFIFVFSPPRGMSHIALFLWLLLGSLAFRTAGAVYRIPYMSFGAELSQNYVERTTIISVRSLFGLAGTLATAGLSFLLFFPKDSAGVNSKLNYASYPRMGVAFGCVMTVTALIACLGTLPQRELSAPARLAASTKDFFSGFALALRNRSFRSTWLSFVLFFVGVVLNAVVAVNYFTWYAQIHDNRVLSGIQTSFYLGAVAGVICWLVFARHGEKHKMYLAATLGMASLLWMAFLLIGHGRPFAPGSVVMPLIAGHAIGGLLASAVWVLPASMLADIADADELSSGQRREGIYFGILSLGEKIGSGGALLIAGLLLNFFVHLAPAASSQSPAAIERLGMVYGPLPGVMLVAAALLIVPYGLDRKAVQNIQEQLARRAKGTAA
ncbi:MAG: MFS transporter, partial [Bryobacteraceae bacterium]